LREYRPFILYFSQDFLNVKITLILFHIAGQKKNVNKNVFAPAVPNYEPTYDSAPASSFPHHRPHRSSGHPVVRGRTSGRASTTTLSLYQALVAGQCWMPPPSPVPPRQCPQPTLATMSAGAPTGKSPPPPAPHMYSTCG
jgi:hypothetical protein